MKSIFEKAAAFRITEEPVLEVETRGYGVASKADGFRYIFTRNVSDCSGLALLSNDGNHAAIAHVFSRAEFIQGGRDQLERHARLVWEELEKALPENTNFNGVAFGGWRNPMPDDQPHQEINAIVSSWISDAFLDAVIKSGRIEVTDDVRFQQTCAGVIDLEKTEIIVGRHKDGLQRQFPSNFAKEKQVAQRFSCGWSLHS